jgi:hypothetical protein
VLNISYFRIGTFRNMCAVTNMADLCSSLISRFPYILIRYLLNDAKMVQDVLIIFYIIITFTGDFNN